MKNKKWNFFLLIFVTLIVLYFLLKDEFFEILHEMIHIHPFWLLFAFFLMFGYWFLRAIILRHIVLEFKEKYSFQKAMRLQLVTQFFNAVTPFSTGGQPFQIYTLKKEGISYNNGTNIVMQEFILYQIALVFLGITAIIYNHFFPLFEEVKILEYLVSLGFVINLIVIIVLFILAFFKKFDTFLLKLGVTILKKLHIIKNSKKILDNWQEQIDNFNIGAKKLIQNKKRFAYLILLEIAALCSLYIIPCSLLYGMGYYNTINGVECIVSSAYVMLIGSFVPIPGGTGGLEYGFLQFFGNFLKGPVLSALMLLWRFITYYLGMIIGAITLNWRVKK